MNNVWNESGRGLRLIEVHPNTFIGGVWMAARRPRQDRVLLVFKVRKVGYNNKNNNNNKEMKLTGWWAKLA
jgi:hypothetical protein